MKSLLTVVSLACFLACPLLAEGGKVGKVSFFIGAAKIKPVSSESFKAVKMNLPVSEGDRIQTVKAEVVEVTLTGGSVIRIAEESDVALLVPGGNVSASVKNGKIWANIKKLSKRNASFEVTSGTATAAIRGTVVRMDNVPQDSMTKVLVYQGKVDVGPGAALAAQQPPAQPGERKEIAGPQEIPGPYEVSLMEWVTLVKGQQINVRPDGKYHKFKFDQQKDAEDPWVKLNQERDKLVAISHEEAPQPAQPEKQPAQPEPPAKPAQPEQPAK